MVNIAIDSIDGPLSSRKKHVVCILSNRFFFFFFRTNFLCQNDYGLLNELGLLIGGDP